MKKLFLALSLAIFTLATVAGCGGGGTEQAADKPIVVGLDDNFPPMGFRDEANAIVGFDVDLAKEATTRLGVPVEFKAIDWSSKEAELASHRVDVLWNGLDITEKRKENMLFSNPYMDNRQIIFVTKGNPNDIKTEADLAGKVIGTQSGATTQDYIESNADFRNSLAEVKYYSDYVSAFLDLQNGRLDAVVGDEIVGRYQISKSDDTIEAVPVAVGPVSEFGIGFAKDNQALKDKVQKVLDEMKKDGTTAKISEKWFGADITK